MPTGTLLTGAPVADKTVDISTDALVYIAEDAGEAVHWRGTGRQRLLVSNVGAVALTATVVSPREIDGLAVADLAVTVPVGDTKLIGPFRRDVFNDAAGYVQVVFTASGGDPRANVLLIE